MSRTATSPMSSSETPCGCCQSARAAVSIPGGLLGAIGRDWSLSGIVTLQSGLPLAVTQVTNFNAFAGFGTQRPNLIGDPELAGDRAHAGAMVQHVGVRGRAAVHAGNGLAQPRAWSLVPQSRPRDRAPRPAWRPRRRSNAASRCSISRTPRRFNAPNTVVGSPAFGTITSAGDPRVVQLALKYLF